MKKSQYGKNKYKLTIHDCPQKGMEYTINFISRKFPNISHVSTDYLKQKLDDDEKDIIILDIREAKEYQVSHIRNAINIPPSISVKKALEILQNKQVNVDIDSQDNDIEIFCYCSIGYRSSKMVRLLQKYGINNIHNVKGSIFEWINEGKQVIDAKGKIANKVHSYNQMWSVLLNDTEKVIY